MTDATPRPMPDQTNADLPTQVPPPGAGEGFFEGLAVPLLAFVWVGALPLWPWHWLIGTVCWGLPAWDAARTIVRLRRRRGLKPSLGDVTGDMVAVLPFVARGWAVALAATAVLNFLYWATASPLVAFVRTHVFLNWRRIYVTDLIDVLAFGAVVFTNWFAFRFALMLQAPQRRALALRRCRRARQNRSADRPESVPPTAAPQHQFRLDTLFVGLAMAAVLFAAMRISIGLGLALLIGGLLPAAVLMHTSRRDMAQRGVPCPNRPAHVEYLHALLAVAFGWGIELGGCSGIAGYTALVAHGLALASDSLSSERSTFPLYGPFCMVLVWAVLIPVTVYLFAVLQRFIAFAVREFMRVMALPDGATPVPGGRKPWLANPIPAKESGTAE